MIRSRFKILVVLCALLTSINVQASEWVTVDVTAVRAFQSQVNQYVIVSNFSNPHNCTGSTNLVILRADNTDWKLMHATLFAGFLAGKTIKLRVNGCNTGNASAIIDGVEIMR